MADAVHYPSPMLAVGWCHSVTVCLANSGGTILCLSGLNKIIGVTGTAGTFDNVCMCETHASQQRLHTS